MKKIFFLFLTLLSTIALAIPQYAIIIDANDTASKLSLFQYEKTEKLPVIKTIFSESTTPPLLSFAKNPDHAGESLKKLLDDAKNRFQYINTQNVTIDLFGTENISLLSKDQQEKIYGNVKQFIKNNYNFRENQIETLPEKNLNVYYWLAANYLADNIENPLGLIRIDNFSTRIVFLNNGAHQQEDNYLLDFNGHHYNIYSKSFPTFGLTQSLNAMNKNKLFYTCYPIDYPCNAATNGNFNSLSCATNYNNVIYDFSVSLPHNQKFLITGYAHHIYEDFLGAADPDQNSYSARLDWACTLRWSLMKKEYDNFSEQELPTICAHAVFIKKLIYDFFHLQGNQLWPTEKINGKEINWTIGKILAS